MNCRDFDQVWNRLLDDEPGSRRRDAASEPAFRRELERRLREHAEVCEDCRARDRGFETLREALRAWAVRPQTDSTTAAPDLAEWVLEAATRPTPVKPRRRRAWIAASALVAAAVAAFAILPPGPSRSLNSPVEAPAGAVDPTARRGLLGAAVDDATAASWHLARLATEPAARLGREMIDASFPPSEPRVLEIALLEPATDPEPGSDSFAPELFSRMGGYLSAGVEPVSTSAREAFGFLRPPMSY